MNVFSDKNCFFLMNFGESKMFSYAYGKLFYLYVHDMSLGMLGFLIKGIFWPPAEWMCNGVAK